MTVSRRIKYTVAATKALFGFNLSLSPEDALQVAREVCTKNRVAYISHEIVSGKLIVIGERR